MQREEKQLDAALEALLQRINDLKTSIRTLLFRLENEYASLSWPSFLDSYAVISGQMNTLLKVMKNDKTPLLRNLIVLPLVLSPDPDEELKQATEGRVVAFSHDITPDMLRTKPDPDVEQRQNQFEQRATQVPPETAQKQINALNKVVNHVLEQITHSREDWENEATVRAAAAQTCVTADTHTLIAAVGLGKNLKTLPIAVPAQPGPGRAQAGPAPGKTTSTIKTTIKAASQVHPYNR
uniref:Mediator of RNA polymerase II transcription subunit 8 n=1 Tax=Daphnia similis TaxID=35528 RepID=A0A4Y7LSF1_9CRUS|nr:EOG090X0JK2 [Daphnia similis]SVE71443.1 EOG090X0JK2 [Daphnia similis]SVE72076.1 EOG090X0JK2 [Daphnia similis]SVE72703.1 EOG090X0JK2 [Daphnia similis]